MSRYNLSTHCCWRGSMRHQHPVITVGISSSSRQIISEKQRNLTSSQQTLRSDMWRVFCELEQYCCGLGTSFRHAWVKSIIIPTSLRNIIFGPEQIRIILHNNLHFSTTRNSQPVLPGSRTLSASGVHLLELN